MTTVHTTLLDQFPHLFRKGRRALMLLGVIAFSCYLIGLAFCSQVGLVCVLFERQFLLGLGYSQVRVPAGVGVLSGERQFLQGLG